MDRRLINRQYKLEKIFEYSFRLILVIAAVISIINQNWLNLYHSVITLAMTYIPFLFEKRSHIYLIPEFQFLILLFIFLAQFLGEIHNYYHKFWWWDLLLHSSSGLIFGFVGYILVYMLNDNKKIDLYLSPIFISIFAFTFSMAIAGIWEIYEYFMDQAFGFNMQKSGLDDTMEDMIVCAVGALFASSYGYFATLKHKDTYVARLIRKFVEKNISKDDD